MAKCGRCGKRGLFLKLNLAGICSDCEIKELKDLNEEYRKDIQNLKRNEKASKPLLSKEKLNISNQASSTQCDTSNLSYQIVKQADEINRLNNLIYNKDLKIKELQSQSSISNISEESLDDIRLQYHDYLNKLNAIKGACEAKEKRNLIWNADDVEKMHDIFYNDQYMKMNYKAINVPTLKKMFKQTTTKIKDVYKEYFNAYDNEPRELAIFQLARLSVDVKFDTALKNLKYGILPEIINKLNSDIDNIQALAVTANSKLSNTIPWCLGKVKALCDDALTIEYNYYTEQQRIKEEQQTIKEQIRQEAEERKALERERKRVEKEETKYTNEITSLNSQLFDADEATAKKLQERIAQLEHQLEEMHEKKEQILTLENGKAGYVYVISNIGSFGNDVYKIGMTRRLEPMDRINELSNASVPFPFDVHSFIFSNDAVTLEHNIHISLNERRVNKINLRKEFFNISIDELETMVSELCPTAEFKRTALATQYRQSTDVE